MHKQAIVTIIAKALQEQGHDVEQTLKSILEQKVAALVEERREIVAETLCQTIREGDEPKSPADVKSWAANKAKADIAAKKAKTADALESSKKELQASDVAGKQSPKKTLKYLFAKTKK